MLSLCRSTKLDVSIDTRKGVNRQQKIVLDKRLSWECQSTQTWHQFASNPANKNDKQYKKSQTMNTH